MTSSFARSMTDGSIEARYICVVAMESCPSASEMTWIGTFFDLATVAHVWRVTYVVSRDRQSHHAAYGFQGIVHAAQGRFVLSAPVADGTVYDRKQVGGILARMTVDQFPDGFYDPDVKRLTVLCLR